MDIAQIQKQIGQAGSADKNGLPPVEKWNPAFCGNINLVIKRNGQWWHEGTPFTRAALIQLLASVIKKEGDNYFLVTPVEKIGIEVEDVPFIVIDSTLSTEHTIKISTQIGNSLDISEIHPVELREFEGNMVPYCHIRRNLWARVHQNVLYRWVDEAQKITKGQTTQLYLNSGEYRFMIGEFTQ